MASAAVKTQKKCEFWDKCYRKNKQHREEFLHPGDDNDVEMKPRLVHDISTCDDDDDTTPIRKGGQKRKLEVSKTAITNDNPGTSRESASKKVKVDDSDEEKIAVDYSKPKPVKVTDNASDAKTDGQKGNPSSSNKPKPKPVTYQARRQKCKYWDKCYQTGEAHKKEFYHSEDDATNDDPENNKTRQQTKTALHDLEDGGIVNFNTGYTLERDGNNYTCTCQGFLNQTVAIHERTCKHLKEYLGELFDKARVEKMKSKTTRTPPQHINVSVLLAQKYDEKSPNPVGWWISEKLDGVRGYWNGRCFYSRLGNAFYAPSWFTKDLPTDMALDGELFGGRGDFQNTVSIVKTAESPGWKDIKYHVFDAPKMGSETFEKRLNAVKEYFEEHRPKYAVLVEHVKCTSTEQLDRKLTRILNLGGEGLMIRKPKSVYENFRSSTLLKIKKFYDAEAIVIGHEKGKGVNQNRCGALRCRMACGTEFSVGSGLTDKNRNNPPKIGSIITYKFQELSKKGHPRFPTFVGIRIDMTEPKDAEIRPVLGEDDA